MFNKAILYYEVLRHFRVVTEFVRRRPALLTNIHGGIAYVVTDPGGARRHEIWWPAIYENRKLLEAALLDDRYKEGFNIVERRRHRDRVAEVVGPPPPPTPPPFQGPEFRYFVFEMRSGEIEAVSGDDDDVQIAVNIGLNSAPWEIPLNKGLRISPPGAFFQKNTTYWFTGRTEPPEPRTILWGQIEAVNILVSLADASDSDTDISFSFIKVTGVDVNGNETTLFEKNYEAGHVIIAFQYCPVRSRTGVTG